MIECFSVLDNFDPIHIKNLDKHTYYLSLSKPELDFHFSFESPCLVDKMQLGID